jgi:hypothetical protein
MLKKLMDSQDFNYQDVFSAIKMFVGDLYSVYGTKKITPLALYHRLLQTMDVKDEKSMKKMVDGFRAFLKQNEIHILKNELKKIERNTVIRYGESPKVFLEIQKYIYKTKDESILESIQGHLLTIGTILDPNTEKLAQLEKMHEERAKNSLGLDTTTPEGEFIKDIMETAQESLGGQSMDSNNPMEAMMKLYNSGIAQKLMSGIQNGANGKKMNARKLMKQMQTVMNHMLPPDEDEEEENIASVD